LIGTVRLVDTPAARAALARVLGVDDFDRDASEFGFVDDELAQLPEGPIVQARPLTPHSRNPCADVLEVFKPNAASGAFSSRDERLRNTMVGVCLVLPLFASEFAEPALSRLGAATLQPGSTPSKVSAARFNFGAAIDVAVAIGSDVHDAEISANPVGRFSGGLCLYLVWADQEPFASPLDQQRLTPGRFEETPLALVNRDGELVAAADGPDGNSIRPKAEHVNVVRLRAPGGEARRNLSVAEAVQIELSERVSGKPRRGNPRTDSAAQLQRFAERRGLFGSRNQPHGNGKSHGFTMPENGWVGKNFGLWRMVFASCFVGDFRGGEMGGICAKNPGFARLFDPLNIDLTQ
jgi:hypothetical protein